MKSNLRKKEQRNIFLEGLDRYKERGIQIYIDGREFISDDYEKLIGIREDGSFYMGDYIEAAPGKLTEIHFDKVYLK